MKKFLFYIAVVLSFCSCTRTVWDKTTGVKDAAEGRRYDVTKEEIDGHEYLVFTFIVYQGAGVTVIHSESCHCKNIEK